MTDGSAAPEAGRPAAASRRARSRPEPSQRVGGGVDRVGGLRGTPLLTILVSVIALLLFLPRQELDLALLGTTLVVAVGLVAIGVVWPAVAVRRVQVDVRSPAQATVGDEVLITVSVRGAGGGAEVRVLDPTSPWHRVVGEDTGEIPHRADRRGSFPLLRVEVRVVGPLAVVAAHRAQDILLPHVVDIGPRSVRVELSTAGAPAAGVGDPTASAGLSGDVVRAVRPYVSGDPAHLVHWPTSARTGELVVREMEPPGRLRLALVVDLVGLGAETEAVASVACGVARQVLAQGGEVILLTAEVDGPAAGPVRSVTQLGRRLARAGPGAVASPPEGWVVLDVGDWWRSRRAWDAPSVSVGGPAPSITLAGSAAGPA